MEQQKTKRRKANAAPKKDTGRGKKWGGHVCTDKCSHTCGELGGRTAEGKLCARVGGWGVKGVKPGHLALCRNHDGKDRTPLNANNCFNDPDLEGLTDKQAMFVIHYCGQANGNATEAAALAGYAPGERPSQGVQGTLNLKNPRISAAITKRMKALTAPSEEVGKLITGIARTNAARLFTFDEQGRPQLNLTEETLAEFGPLIREIKVDSETGIVTDVKLHNAHHAQRDLAKINGLFSDAPQVNLHLHTRELSDDELLKRMRARTSSIAGVLAGDTPPRSAPTPNGNGKHE